MSEHQQETRSLPENAYRELKQGEEYKPVMPADRTFPEVTWWSLWMGLLMALIFSAAAAFHVIANGKNNRKKDREGVPAQAERRHTQDLLRYLARPQGAGLQAAGQIPGRIEAYLGIFQDPLQLM